MLLKRKSLSNGNGNSNTIGYINIPYFVTIYFDTKRKSVTNSKIFFKINNFIGNCYLVTFTVTIELLLCYQKVLPIQNPKKRWWHCHR